MVAPERVSLLCVGIYSRSRGCRLFACVGGVCESIDNVLFARALAFRPSPFSKLRVGFVLF